jgi:hypothetical protein
VPAQAAGIDQQQPGGVDPQQRRRRLDGRGEQRAHVGVLAPGTPFLFAGR